AYDTRALDGRLRNGVLRQRDGLLGRCRKANVSQRNAKSVHRVRRTPFGPQPAPWPAPPTIARRDGGVPRGPGGPPGGPPRRYNLYPSQRATTALARQFPTTFSEVRAISRIASTPSSTAIPSLGRLKVDTVPARMMSAARGTPATPLLVSIRVSIMANCSPVVR